MRTRSVCIYVSQLAMTEVAMCIVFGERNSGAYKLSGGDVGGSGIRCLWSFCKHVPLQQSGSSHCLPLQLVVSQALYQIQMV